MAMVVKNNMSAITTLNTLNKNSSALSKSLQKVSSGMKINSAADDASGYAISERMRVQIRSLDQANQNTQNGNSMMKVAEGAVSSTVDILKTLKEKAINAANDSNTDADRQTIQKELDQSIDQINDNANVTFNGKYLVDGSKNSQGNATYTTLTNQSLDVNTKASDELTSLKARNGDSLEIVATDSITVSYVKAGKTYSTNFKVKDDNGKIATLQDIFTKAEQIDDTSKIFADATNKSVTESMGTADATAAKAKMDQADTDAYGAAGNNWATATTASKGGAFKAAVVDKFAKSVADYNKAMNDANTPDKKIDTSVFGDLMSIDETTTGNSKVKANMTEKEMIKLVTLLKDDANYNSLKADTTNGTNAVAAVDALEAYEPAKKAYEDAHTAVVSSATVGIDAAGDKVDTASGEKGISITANNSGIDGQISGLNISVRDSKGNVKKSANAALDAFGETIRAQNKSDDNALTFQVGSNANQSIKVGLTDMRAEALGLKGADGTTLNISTQTKANAAVNVLDNALQKALDQQTTLGSVQSRLEYTSSNLTTSSTNVQSAESTIRDADMAKEMTEYTKNNVLMQAAQSMLAQANQSSSSVLSLLQ